MDGIDFEYETIHPSIYPYIHLASEEHEPQEFFYEFWSDSRFCTNTETREKSVVGKCDGKKLKKGANFLADDDEVVAVKVEPPSEKFLLRQQLKAICKKIADSIKKGREKCLAYEDDPELKALSQKVLDEVGKI